MTISSVMLGIFLPLLGAGMIIAFWRIVRGPGVVDRVVGLDALGTLGIGAASVYAVGTGRPVYLDIAVALALIMFLGTVAFAYYLERRAAG